MREGIRFSVASVLLLATSLALAVAPGRTGPCQDGGQLSVVLAGEFTGSARVALSVVQFSKLHNRFAGSEPAWLSSLSGPSVMNRVYRSGGLEVVVATVCESDSCAGARAYVAFQAREGLWGATVVEGGSLRQVFAGPQTTLAMHPAALQNALQCAIQWDLQE